MCTSIVFFKVHVYDLRVQCAVGAMTNGTHSLWTTLDGAQVRVA